MVSTVLQNSRILISMSKIFGSIPSLGKRKEGSGQRKGDREERRGKQKARRAERRRGREDGTETNKWKSQHGLEL